MFLPVLYFVPLTIALLCLLVQFYFLFGPQGAVKRVAVRQPEEGVKLPAVSVIICARNEVSNLKLHLTKILEQDYPLFEVVVVNDCSTDDSKWVLKDFEERYPHLKIVHLGENIKLKHGKKFAVTLGIKAARYDNLVFTDADCYPSSNEWLRYMAASFSTGKEIVLGYSPYVCEKGWLNAYIRYETFLTAVNYLGFALRGNPYMGVGRNLAYKKELFFRNKGFGSHMHVLSGDDDLFVNQNATASNTAVCLDGQAFMWSEPKHTLIDYLRQKKRHFGAGKWYKATDKKMLSVQAGSGFLFYVLLFVALFVQWSLWPLVLALYLMRLAGLYMGYIALMKKLTVGDLLVVLPLLDILYQLGNPLLAVRTWLGKEQVVWK